jgi:aldehyde:ferredoxin oxidoreductase
MLSVGSSKGTTMSLKRKIAYIDLTTNEVKTASIPEELRKKYLGGRGLDIYLLFNHLKEKIEPFSPDNVVIVSAGLLGGTLASASSWTHIMTKSPLTGYLASADMGGFFAPELRWAGFDHLVITGKASKPVYLFIHNGKIEIRDASAVWGKSVQETQDILREKLHDEAVQTMCIGPAGEKLIRFANVATRHQNVGARGGTGAVFGSKNLKAITARGTLGIEIKYPKEAIEYDRQIVRKICSTEFGKEMQQSGTMFRYKTVNDMGLLRTNNFQSNRFADSEELEGKTMGELSFGMDACFACQLHCRFRYIISEEPYKGVYSQGPGFESQSAWGALVGCKNINTVLIANQLANSYGLDTLETGSLISWAMELYENGILTDEDTGGLRLEFGNDEAVLEMIRRIGDREGLGDILAEGGLRAAQKIGQGSEKYLVHVKGLSNLQTDERTAPGLALGLATATSSSDHLRSRPDIDLVQLPESIINTMYNKPYPYSGKLSTDYRSYQGKAWQVYWHELCYMAADMIGMCKYHTLFLSPDMPGFEEFSKMIYLNTGLQFSAEEIWQCADRAYTLERLFNIREGAARKDDWLVDRYFDEPTCEGPEEAQGKTLDREKFRAMIDEYYQVHGWDNNGVPTSVTLKKLDLDKEPGHQL